MKYTPEIEDRIRTLEKIGFKGTSDSEDCFTMDFHSSIRDRLVHYHARLYLGQDGRAPQARISVSFDYDSTNSDEVFKSIMQQLRDWKKMKERTLGEAWGNAMGESLEVRVPVRIELNIPIVVFEGTDVIELMKKARETTNTLIGLEYKVEQR